jgi:hypothetical protein
LLIADRLGRKARRSPGNPSLRNPHHSFCQTCQPVWPHCGGGPRADAFHVSVPSGAQGWPASPAVRAEAGALALAPENAVDGHHDDCHAKPQIASAPCGKLAPVFADVALRVAPNNTPAKRQPWTWVQGQTTASPPLSVRLGRCKVAEAVLLEPPLCPLVRPSVLIHDPRHTSECSPAIATSL